MPRDPMQGFLLALLVQLPVAAGAATNVADTVPPTAAPMQTFRDARDAPGAATTRDMKPYTSGQEAAAESDAQEAQDIVASLRASLRLLDAQGQPVEHAEDRRTVRLRLDLSDAQTGKPPDDLQLEAWVRPADPANARCEDAVRAFRVTRSVTQGNVDLNGILLVTLNRDASVGIVDPRLNLSSSNMLAAHSLETLPAATAVDHARMRLLATFPQQGELRALSLHSGAAAPLLKGLAHPTAIAMAGADSFWLAEEGNGSITRRGSDGELRESIALAAAGTAMFLRPVAADPAVAAKRRAAPSRLGAFAADGALLLMDADSGRLIARGSAGERIADAAFLSNGAILSLAANAATATLRFADRMDLPQRFPIGVAATRLAAAPDGRFAIAYAPGESMFALIDIASAKVVQSFQLDAGSVSDVLLTGTAGFVLSHDGGFVAAMDLAALKPGRAASLRRVPLAGSSARPSGGGPYLVSLAPAPLMLVVDPAQQTGWVMPETAATSEIPPMDSVRLRGGVPAGVIAVDRAFRKRAPGRYETAWAFDAGAYELVLSAGSGFSRCISFTVDGDRRHRFDQPVVLQVAAVPVEIRAGVVQQLTLVLRDREGRDLTPEAIDLLFPSMVSSWREVVAARRGSDGALRVSVTFPHPGSYAVQPLQLPAGLVLRSAPVLEVSP